VCRYPKCDMRTSYNFFWRLLVCLSIAPCYAFAGDTTCPRNTLRAYPPTVNFRVDNDLFGGKQQDEGYSNGALITLVSPNLRDYIDDPCLPALARWANRRLRWLHASDFEQQNMIFSIGQALFTPSDYTRSDLIVEDRPYAAVLLVNFGYNTRIGNDLRSTQLALGMAGPSALGKQTQHAVHRMLGSEQFQGWDNQIRDEPVFMLLHTRLKRIWISEKSDQSWGGDSITRWGVALGNLTTFVNLGSELRWGWKLPDDFGSSPLNPAGENTAPPRPRIERMDHARLHLFLSLDARWMVHDISLDGNAFQRSHSVHKRPLLGEIGYGLALMRGRWKFALARYHRSREFDGQPRTPVFGSFTLSRTL